MECCEGGPVKLACKLCSKSGNYYNRLPFDAPAEAPEFDGETYEAEQDHERLGAQALRVWGAVRDGYWRTLSEIEAICGDPQASISARLRDFRKKKFGENVVERQRRGEGKKGLHEYRVLANPQGRLALNDKEPSE